MRSPLALAELALDRPDAVYRTDLRGPLAVAQAVVPAMAKQGFGRIANVGTWSAWCRRRGPARTAPRRRRRSQASQRTRPKPTTSRALADALTRARAARVVRLGRGSGAITLLAMLPAALRDRLFARAFGLSALEQGGKSSSYAVDDGHWRSRLEGCAPV